MTTPAAIYVNPDHDSRTVAEQIEDCLRTAERLALDLRYWVHDPLDAPPIVADGRACGLVIATPDVITPSLVLDAVTAQIEMAGGRVYTPTSRQMVYHADVAVQMAARLHRRGWSDEQVADVLETDEAGARALLQQAARRGLLGAVPLMGAWLHARAGRAAMVATAAAALITGVEWAETPRTTAIPPPVTSPAPGRTPPRVQVPPTSAAPSRSPTALPSSSPVPSSPSPAPSPTPSRSRLPPPLPLPTVPACLRSLPAQVDLPRCVEDLLPTG